MALFIAGIVFGIIFGSVVWLVGICSYMEKHDPDAARYAMSKNALNR